MENKKFEFTVGTGYTANSIILINPKFEGTSVRATKIAELEYIQSNGTRIYTTCDACEVIIGGGPFILTEFKGELN